MNSGVASTPRRCPARRTRRWPSLPTLISLIASSGLQALRVVGAAVHQPLSGFACRIARGARHPPGMPCRRTHAACERSHAAARRRKARNDFQKYEKPSEVPARRPRQHVDSRQALSVSLARVLHEGGGRESQATGWRLALVARAARRARRRCAARAATSSSTARACTRERHLLEAMVSLFTGSTPGIIYRAGPKDTTGGAIHHAQC